MINKVKAIIKELKIRYRQRKLPPWYKNLRKRVKRIFRGENLGKLIILFATLALIATSVLPYIL